MYTSFKLFCESISTKYIVYHSSAFKFDKFSKKYLGEHTKAESAKKGFFFSDNKDVAISYHSIGKYKESEIENNQTNSVEDLNKLLKGDDSITDIQFAIFRDDDGILKKYSKIEIEKIKQYIDQLNDSDDEAGDFYEIGLSDEDNYILQPNCYLYTCELTIFNPLIVDFKGKDERSERYSKLIDDALKNGNDGCIFKNTYDAGSSTGDILCNIYAVFDESQIKIINTLKG